MSTLGPSQMLFTLTNRMLAWFVNKFFISLMNELYYGPQAGDPASHRPLRKISIPPEYVYKPPSILGIRDTVFTDREAHLALYQTTNVHPFPVKGKSPPCPVLTPPAVHHRPHPSTASLVPYDLDVQCLLSKPLQVSKTLSAIPLLSRTQSSAKTNL